MPNKILVPALKKPTTPAAPRMVTKVPPRGPSVLGDDDELEMPDPNDGEILFGDVVTPEPSKPVPKPLPRLIPSPGGKLKGLPVVKSSKALQEELAIEAQKAELARVPAPGMTIPPMECSTCHVGAACGKRDEGNVCYYEKSFSSFDVRSTTGIISAMEMMIAQNLKRLQLMFLSEQLTSGGLTDPQITRLSGEIQGQMMNLIALKKQSATITVEASGKPAEGILTRLFGARTNAPSPIDLHPEESQDRVTVKMTRAARVARDEEDD